MIMALGLILAACGGQGATSSAPASEEEAPASEPVATDDGTAFEAMSYPEDGPADCDAEGYTGNISEIRAEDESTVVFSLCNPDVAFLSKVAFTSFAINDTAWLEKYGADGSIVDNVNGTGPYRLDAWNRGSDITMSAFEDYWGDAPLSPTVIFRWSAEAAQRLVELQSGAVDGIDNPGPDDFETIEADPNL